MRLLPLIMFLSFSECFANGNVSHALIKSHIVQDGKFFIYPSVAPSDSSPCSDQKRFVMDGTTANGKVMMAQVLTAYALEKQVSIGGSGSCEVWSGTETALWVLVE